MLKGREQAEAGFKIDSKLISKRRDQDDLKSALINIKEYVKEL